MGKKNLDVSSMARLRLMWSTLPMGVDQHPSTTLCKYHFTSVLQSLDFRGHLPLQYCEREGDFRSVHRAKTLGASPWLFQAAIFSISTFGSHFKSSFSFCRFSTCNPLQPMYLQEYDNLTFVSLQNDSWTHFNPLTSYWGITSCHVLFKFYEQ